MRKIVLLFSLFIIAAGCKKFVDLGPSPTIVESRIVFEDEAAAVSAVTGIYAQALLANAGMVNGGAGLYTALSSDELYNTASNTNADQFNKNVLLPANSIVNNNFWSPAYRFIYHCNAVLEGLERSASLPNALRYQLQGEVKCMRALLYFYLVNLFGDIPLVLTTNYQENAVKPRTASADVYAQIISDLRDAEAKLPEAYPSAGRFRPNKWVAVSLLARVLLYQEKWAEAETKSSAVIQSGIYELLTDPNAVFLNNSKEVIWQMTKENSNAADGGIFVPSSATARPAYAITDTFFRSFTPVDKRRSSWLKLTTVSGKDYYYPYKYKQRTQTNLTESQVVLRLAELLLVRAEARALQSDWEGAVQDLNKLRERAGIAALPAIAGQDVIKAIEQERKAELFAEWGHRWLDLKRWGKADAHLGGIKPTWQSWAQWYPIPLTEMERNPFLIQNQGY